MGLGDRLYNELKGTAGQQQQQHLPLARSTSNGQITQSSATPSSSSSPLVASTPMASSSSTSSASQQPQPTSPAQLLQSPTPLLTLIPNELNLGEAQCVVLLQYLGHLVKASDSERLILWIPFLKRALVSPNLELMGLSSHLFARLMIKDEGLAKELLGEHLASMDLVGTSQTQPGLFPAICEYGDLKTRVLFKLVSDFFTTKAHRVSSAMFLAHYISRNVSGVQSIPALQSKPFIKPLPSLFNSPPWCTKLWKPLCLI